MITLNIGLDTNTNTNGNIGPATVLRELENFFTVGRLGIERSTTEPTVIAQCTLKTGHDLARSVTHLCHLLAQDCIAVSHDNGQTGELIGPNAAKWGTFNPAYFLPL